MSIANSFGALFGGGAQIFAADEQNKQARHERKAMQRFQERMSNTAHQRQVSDLEKAGLNPLLSINSGASNPSGGMAPVVNEAQGAIAAARELATIDNINADTLNKEVDVNQKMKTLTGADWIDQQIDGLRRNYEKHFGGESSQPSSAKSFDNQIQDSGSGSLTIGIQGGMQDPHPTYSQSGYSK